MKLQISTYFVSKIVVHKLICTQKYSKTPAKVCMYLYFVSVVVSFSVYIFGEKVSVVFQSHQFWRGYLGYPLLN